ncbi:MAG: TlpA family protein disulfide reductase [Epsilonproteobacteria bacterium]|nr:TlpA family protein disulfide reductase [Campylobacterota bacterium]
MANFFKLLITSLLFITFIDAKENSKILTFKIPTIDGKTLTIKEAKNGLEFEDYKGKVVLLEFWGTHCPPCLMSIEHYKELMNEYKDKVAMIAVEVQMTPKSKLKEFVKSKNINYDVVAQEDATEFIQYVAARAGWRGAIPYLLIFDKEGNVIDIKRGYASKDYVKQVIEYGLNPPKNTKK